MLQRLRRWFRAEEAAPKPGLDRASGEDALLTQDEDAREASAPVTPRVKWGSEPR